MHARREIMHPERLQTGGKRIVMKRQSRICGSQLQFQVWLGLKVAESRGYLTTTREGLKLILSIALLMFQRCLFRLRLFTVMLIMSVVSYQGGIPHIILKEELNESPSQRSTVCIL
ncbi:hypothetical protein L211DRAFT_624511 [Terfezia boudieri ATCC MYA-4762]|uniref:Uncharacterized protein n=1 Tax=Terfezia boudieri ATCC MYA-4762 TaxID=1051890 RepID=A0A3N4LNP7_9PEZI|nr:hypothetical protein L211DRAFT_624511 [Terfezia boudieri ATCC MYA-4762]